MSADVPMTGADVPGFTLAELLKKDLPPRHPMVGSWLVERSLNMVHAAAGRGKSIFCMALSLALAGGVDFLGWEVPKPRRVIYVDAEMDPTDLKERARDLLRASGMTKEQQALAGVNLKIVSQQDLKEEQQLPDLHKARGKAAQWLVKWCDSYGADLVILDNLSTLADIDDENSAGAFSFAITIGSRLKAKGVSTILVHHNRKGNGGAESFRGSGKLDAPLDTRWELGKLDDSEAASIGDALAFTLSPHKVRMKRGEDVRKFAAALIQAQDGPQWQILEQTAPEKLREIVEAVQTEKHGTQRELATALGISPGEVSKRRDKAIEAGLITKDDWQDALAAGKAAGDF